MIPSALYEEALRSTSPATALSIALLAGRPVGGAGGQEPEP